MITRILKKILKILLIIISIPILLLIIFVLIGQFEVYLDKPETREKYITIWEDDNFQKSESLKIGKGKFATFNNTLKIDDLNLQEISINISNTLDTSNTLDSIDFITINSLENKEE